MGGVIVNKNEEESWMEWGSNFFGCGGTSRHQGKLGIVPGGGHGVGRGSGGRGAMAASGEGAGGSVVRGRGVRRDTPGRGVARQTGELLAGGSGSDRGGRGAGGGAKNYENTSDGGGGGGADWQTTDSANYATSTSAASRRETPASAAAEVGKILTAPGGDQTDRQDTAEAKDFDLEAQGIIDSLADDFGAHDDVWDRDYLTMGEVVVGEGEGV